MYLKIEMLFDKQGIIFFELGVGQGDDTSHDKARHNNKYGLV